MPRSWAGKSQVLEEKPFVLCDACGCGIGQDEQGNDYMERTPCEVGDKILCSHCFKSMNKWGRIEITGHAVFYLHPDGSIKKSVRRELAK